MLTALKLSTTCRSLRVRIYIETSRCSVVVEVLCYNRKVAVSRPDDVNAFFFNLPSLFSSTRPWDLFILEEKWVLEAEQMFVWSRARPVREADIVTAI
jgi:hypothetical protein